ncbi:MAG: type II/IV secretion system protein, partial [Planctomycetota bacterium]
KDFARDVQGVLAVKLIRRLCDACRVAYTPTPEMLKKLGIPAGKVEQLYRSPKPDEVDKPCKECGGIGFRGRTALFEMLVPDDRFRSVLAKTPQMDAVRKAARESGMRTMQEEGILLVARGVTSVPELSRVLKA